MIGKHLLSIGCMLIALVVSVPGPGVAANRKASLQVGATVLPWFKAQARQQTASYEVTAADIARGYTDLAAAVTVQIQTNMVQGQILLQVASFGAEQVLVKQAGTVAEQLFLSTGAGSQSQQRSFDLRVVLTPEVVAGTYPLHFSMQTTVL